MESLRKLDMGRVGESTLLLQQECHRIELQLSVPTSSGDQDDKTIREETFKKLIKVMHEPIDSLVPSVLIVSITLSAAHALSMIIPPLITMAPGFICGSVATKAMLPHASNP